LYETKGPIAYITLNRPRVLNAYNDTMGDELLQAHRAFDQDDDLHVLIISGAGRAFCSGADVRQRQLRPLGACPRISVIGSLNLGLACQLRAQMGHDL
jgi:enoyl-CoA hydratase/carnithine racemase